MMPLRLFIARALLVFAAAALSGCVSRGLAIHNYQTGDLQTTFQAGEVPAAVILGGGDIVNSTLSVVKLPERQIVLRQLFTEDLDAFMTGASDRPPGGGVRLTKDGQPQVLLTPLAGGRYVAELWTDGKMDDSREFSIEGGDDRTRPPSVTPSSFGIRGGQGGPPGSASLEELDAVVHLTIQQMDEAKRILAAHETAAGNGGSAEDARFLRGPAEDQIRALLNEEQRKRYAGEPILHRSVLARLRDLATRFSLTEEQKIAIGQLLVDDEDRRRKLRDFGAEPSGNGGSVLRTQLRAQLTPEQQKLFDEAPPALSGPNPPNRGEARSGNVALDAEAAANPAVQRAEATRDFLMKFLWTCLPLRDQFGAIDKITPAGGSSHHSLQSPLWTGESRFTVKGSRKTDLVTVYWQSQGNEPLEVKRIESSSGTILRARG